MQPTMQPTTQSTLNVNSIKQPALNSVVLQRLIKEVKMEKEQKNRNKITICLDRELKEKTEKKFKSSYGISLSSGLALLMTALIEEKIQIFK